MNTHYLKTWPIPFTAIWDGLKPYEVRRDDRNFQIGDELVLQIWDPGSKTYGRRTIEATVTYKTAGGQFGIPAGLCVLGLGNIRRIMRAEPAGEADPFALRPSPFAFPAEPSITWRGSTSDLATDIIEVCGKPSAIKASRDILDRLLTPSDRDLRLELERSHANACRDEWKTEAEKWQTKAQGLQGALEKMVEANHESLRQRDEVLASLRNAHANVRDLQAQLTSDAEARRVEREALQAELETMKRGRDEYHDRWREAHRAASRAATEDERRRAEGEGRKDSPSASEAVAQPKGMSETMVKIVACGDGEDTRRCTRWCMPLGTVGEMLDDLTEGVPTKTPYHAWLRGSYHLSAPLTPVFAEESLKNYEGKTLLVYAEGREADRLAYANPLRQAQFSAANKVVGTPRQCKDGGACHHECGESACWREANCAPLSGSGLGDDWKPRAPKGGEPPASRLPAQPAPSPSALRPSPSASCKEPTITWRGSSSDLATDILEVCGKPAAIAASRDILDRTHVPTARELLKGAPACDCDGYWGPVDNWVHDTHRCLKFAEEEKRRRAEGEGRMGPAKGGT